MLFYESENKILFHYSKKTSFNTHNENVIDSVTIYNDGTVLKEQYEIKTNKKILQEIFLLSNNQLEKIREVMRMYKNEIDLYSNKISTYADDVYNFVFNPNITTKNDTLNSQILLIIVKHIMPIVENRTNNNVVLRDAESAPDNHNDKVGETNIATNGQLMKIIAYHNINNIDVEFEDGTVIKNKRYHCFKNGEIRNPNVSVNRKKRIGEVSINTDGYQMTIIDYRGRNNVDVQLEDGSIITNQKYSDFLKGIIKNPNQHGNAIDHIGQTNTAANGQQMKIIAYRDKFDIDIEFEDGTVVTNKKYSNFLKGSIKNINSKVGETNFATNGQKMTIIAYHNVNNIDIEFEDGTVIKNKKYHCFKNGEINNPNLSKIKSIRIGEVNIATNGQLMEIIGYRRCDDIDVRFEDGTVVTNKTYQAFENGNIANPNCETHKKNAT